MSSNKHLIFATVAVLFATATLFFMSPELSQENLTHQNLKCIARSTIVARGQDWVDKKVPYNQGGTHDGYRTDCSGFVSMCWELSKPGLTTQTMHTVASNINKDQLAPGDALNCDSEHIILFAGWADGAKTHFVGMEETKPG